MTYRHFDVQLVDRVHVVTLNAGKLADTPLVAEVQDELLTLIRSEPIRHVLVDFQLVQCCSTAIINALIQVKRSLAAAGGKLKLAGMRSTVRSAYRVLNLDGTVFEIHSTRNEALRADW